MPESLEELEERHEREIQELDEKKQAHLEAANATAKGKVRKAAVDAAERDVETWDYDIGVRHEEELEELQAGQRSTDAGGDDDAAESVADTVLSKVAESADAEAARIQQKKDKAARKKGLKGGKDVPRESENAKPAELQVPKSPSMAGCRSPTMSGMRSPSQRWMDDPVSVEDVAPATEVAKPDFEIIEGIQPFSDAVQADPRMKVILEEVTALSKDAFEEDALGMVTRKTRWKLTLLVRTEGASSSQGAQKVFPDLPKFCLDGTADAEPDELEDEGGPPLIGFIVYRLRPELQAFSIAKIAVVPEHRGKGHGGRLMHWVKQMAKKQKDIQCISLSSLPEAVRFYKKLGFQPIEVNIPDTEDNVEGQVYMECQLRKGSRKSR